MLRILIVGAILCCPLLADFIDFESLPDSTPITNQYPGLIFSHATVLSAFISLNESEFPPNSGTNVVFDDGGAMTITFLTAAINFSGYFTHTVPVSLLASDGSSATSLFSNNLALSGDPGSFPNELISLNSLNGFSSLVITGDPNGGSFTLDDVTIDFTLAPEPASLLLLLMAIAILVSRRILKPVA